MSDEVAIVLGIAVGMTDNEIADLTGISNRTVSRRRQDPEVKERVAEFNEGRFAELQRKLSQTLASDTEARDIARRTTWWR